MVCPWKSLPTRSCSLASSPTVWSVAIRISRCPRRSSTTSSGSWRSRTWGARTWRTLTSFYTSPGFSDEECHLFLATELFDESAETEELERIEIVTAPLAELDEVIRDCSDAKTLVGLLWLRAYER